jgi:hypothetical protein
MLFFIKNSLKFSRINLALVFIFFGCSKKDSFKKPVKECEARLVDVVTPVDAFSINSSNTSLNYSINAEINEISKYYRENLEIYGWQKVVEFEQENIALVYEKPHKFLLIFIMPTKSKNILKVLAYIEEKSD